MSDPHNPEHTAITGETPAHPTDVVEAIVPMMPLVLPAVGALMIFLLAMIAVTMA